MLGRLGAPLSSSEGRRAVGWEGRGVGGVLTWERLASSPGGVVPAWGRVLSSPAWMLVCEGVGRVLGWKGRGVIAWERLASSTGEVGREGGGGEVGGIGLGKTSVFPGRGCACLGKSAVFPSLAAGM